MVINLVIEVHVLRNQTVKIDSKRLDRLVTSERDKSSITQHNLSDVWEVMEDPSLK